MAIDRPSKRHLVISALLASAAVLLLVSMYWIFYVAPLEARMGVVQKIFYFHVPAAMSMYLAFVVCGVSSFLYLLKSSPEWDHLAHSSAEVGVLFGTMVLVTGPLWAKGAWGRYWVWDDPQLTTTLILFLIYATYLFIRAFLGRTRAGRRLPAILAVIGLVDIPLIHFSVRLWRGQHPQVMRGKGGGLAPEMLQAFLIAMAGFLLLAVALIWVRHLIEERMHELNELDLDLLERRASRTKGLALGAGLAILLTAGVVEAEPPKAPSRSDRGPTVSQPRVDTVAEAEPGPSAPPEAKAGRSGSQGTGEDPRLAVRRAVRQAVDRAVRRHEKGFRLMLTAYAIIWLLLLGYVYRLARMQGELERTVADLRARIHEEGGDGP